MTESNSYSKDMCVCFMRALLDQVRAVKSIDPGWTTTCAPLGMDIFQGCGDVGAFLFGCSWADPCVYPGLWRTGPEGPKGLTRRAKTATSLARMLSGCLRLGAAGGGFPSSTAYLVVAAAKPEDVGQVWIEYSSTRVRTHWMLQPLKDSMWSGLGDPALVMPDIVRLVCIAACLELDVDCFGTFAKADAWVSCSK